jgi:hypothetical protein
MTDTPPAVDPAEEEPFLEYERLADEEPAVDPAEPVTEAGLNWAANHPTSWEGKQRIRAIERQAAQHRDAECVRQGHFRLTDITADRDAEIAALREALDRLVPLVMAALLQDAIDREEGNAAIEAACALLDKP